MKQFLKLILGLFFHSEKTHFLIVFQNNNELRSTGGYITHVLELSLGQRRLKKKFLNVNTHLCKHEKIEAPKIIQEMLFDGHLNTWTFRDANYDPDFQKSAQKMIELYNKVYPKQKVSGFLAINFSLVEDLLGSLGSINLEEQTIHSKNLFEYLTATVSDIDRHDKKVLEQRKNILKKLGKKIILKAIKKPWKWRKIIGLVNKAFKIKDLQLYDPKNPKSNFKAEKNQDFLAVIENNYLGLKSNRYIHRSIQHDSVIGSDGQLKSKVTVRWDHLGPYNYPLSGSYRAHIRIYLNQEAILSPSEDYELEKEENLMCLSFKMKLNPNRARLFYFEYKLPTHFHQNQYRFKYFKQPGLKYENVKKSISIPIHLEFSGLQAISNNENVAHKNILNLDRDFKFKVGLMKSKKHPRVYGHEIISKNSILIKFNEAIKIDQAEIKVWKKDKPEEKVEIDSLKRLSGNKWLLIKLKNIPPVKEQFFTTSIKDIFNRNGEVIQSNPKNLTVVYRPKYFKYWQKRIPALKEVKLC